MNENMELKISKLLKMAERASTPDEANAFFEKAANLASLYEINLATARLKATADLGAKRETVTQETIVIGKKGKHTNRTLAELFMAIGQPYGIKFTIAHNSTYLNAIGFPSDIATVKTLWSAISIQMIRFGDEYIRAGEWKAEKVYRKKQMTHPGGYTYEDWGYYPISAQSARSSFHDGFVEKVGTRLRIAHKTAEESAKRGDVVNADGDVVQQESISDPGVTLALVAKTDEIEKFWDEQVAPRVSRRSWNPARGGNQSYRSAEAGRAAGARANLGGGKAVGGQGRALTR